MTAESGDLGELVLELGAPLSLRKGEALFNEGDPSKKVGLQDQQYGKGPVAFSRLLAAWREEGALEGLELR